MPPEINRHVWPQTPDLKKIAVVIAGAGSLGSYEAGVLSELTYALGLLNAVLEPGEGRFVLDVLTGASAGGMTAAILSRVALYEPDRRDRFHSAWVREINMDALLQDDPLQRNALLSKTIIRAIADRHLAAPAPAQPAAASYAPELVRLGLTLSNLNGLDYALQTRSLTLNAPGFLTTRFSDRAQFTLRRGEFAAVDWALLRDSAMASGNFPLAFMPQALLRDAADFAGANPPRLPEAGYLPRDLAYVDGGLFDNEPLGMAINLAAEADLGAPDPGRLFLLVHPNITTSAHKDGDGQTPYLSNQLGLGAVAKRLLTMLMKENAVSDWVRAQKVNDLASWRDDFVEHLTTIVATTEVEGPEPFMQGLGELATRIARKRRPADPAGYEADALQRLRAREQAAYAALASPGAPESLRQRVFLLLLFILDNVADLQDKTPLWLEVVGHDPDTPLAGSQVNGFAGFFNQQWREYDYRRGRVDAWNALTGGAGQGVLGEYPREPRAEQPSKPAPNDPDEYDVDLGGWRKRVGNAAFPRVTFKDIDKPQRTAFRNRISDRAKALLGLSGLKGFLFDRIVRPKLDKLFGGDEG